MLIIWYAVGMRRGLTVENVLANLEATPSDADGMRRYAVWLANNLWHADADYRRELDTNLVAGDEGASDLHEATLALLEPRRVKMHEATKKSVRVWPNPLEAWMQSEVVAAGVAGANEHANGILIDPEREEDLRIRLATAALGMSYDNFIHLQGN